MRGRIGLLGHDPLLYRDLTARENLRYHARLHAARRPERIAECSTRSACSGAPTIRVHTYSRGMVQRLAVAPRRAARPRRCCCSTSRARTSTRRRRDCSSRCSGARAGARASSRATTRPGAGRGRRRAGPARRAWRCSAPRRRTPARRGRSEADVRPTRRRQSSRRPASRTATLAAARAVLRKELRLELRTRESIAAMALFSVTTFVVFHFALDRDTVDGAAGGGRAVGHDAVRRDARPRTGCSSPTTTRAASTASCSRRSTARRCSSPRRSRCSSSSLALELVAVPRSRSCCSAPAVGRDAARACSLVLALADAGDRGRRHARRRARRCAPARATCRRRSLALPLLVPGGDRRRARHRAAARRRRRRAAARRMAG